MTEQRLQIIYRISSPLLENEWDLLNSYLMYDGEVQTWVMPPNCEVIWIGYKEKYIERPDRVIKVENMIPDDLDYISYLFKSFNHLEYIEKRLRPNMKLIYLR